MNGQQHRHLSQESQQRKQHQQRNRRRRRRTTPWMDIVLSIIILCSHCLVQIRGQNATDAPTLPPNKGDSSFDLLTDNLLVRRWKIYEPNVTYNELNFQLRFNVSDYITASFVGYEIYDGHLCSEGNAIITDMNYFTVAPVEDVSNPTVPVGDGWGYREIQLSTTIIPETIINSNSYQEELTSVGSNGAGAAATKAAINYCVRLSLFNNIPTDPLADEINWMETKITLFVNLAGGFTVESSYIEPKPPHLEVANDEFFVEAYLCGNDGMPFPNTTSKTFLQGEPIQVCVKPTLEAINAGVRMKLINNFVFHRGTTQSQDAVVDDGLPASNGLTDILCSEGTFLCSFTTLLVAKFYDGPGTVYGIGEATLQFGSTPTPTNNNVRLLLRTTTTTTLYSTTPRRELKSEEEQFDVKKSIIIPRFNVELNEYLFEVIRGKSGSAPTLEWKPVVGTSTLLLLLTALYKTF